MTLKFSIYAVAVICSIFSFYSDATEVNKYKASSDVKSAHRIPPVQNIERTEKYLVGILIFPIIILCLGVVSVLIYQLILCCRCCFHCCCPNSCHCCYNKFSYLEPDLAIRKLHHRKAIIAFFTFLLFALIIDCLVFVGSGDITKSIRKAGDALESLANIFLQIQTDANDISNSINGVYNATKIYPCSDAFEAVDVQSTLQTYSSQASDYIQKVSSIIGSFPNTILRYKRLIVQQGIHTKDTIILCYFFIVLFFIIMFTIAYFIQYKILLTLSIILTELMVIALTVIAAGEMLIVHVVADFCINPSQSIQTLIAGTNANIEAIVAYYTTCTGDTPFDSDYKTALSEFTQFNTTFYTYYNETISYLVSHGESTDCVVSFKTNIFSIFNSLTSIFNEFTCGPLYNVFDLAIQQSICHSGFSGFYEIWLVHILTSGMLYFVLMASSYFYEMFYPTPQLYKDEADDMGIEDSYPHNTEVAYLDTVEPVPQPEGELVYNKRAPNHNSSYRDDDGIEMRYPVSSTSPYGSASYTQYDYRENPSNSHYN